MKRAKGPAPKGKTRHTGRVFKGKRFKGEWFFNGKRKD